MLAGTDHRWQYVLRPFFYFSLFFDSRVKSINSFKKQKLQYLRRLHTDFNINNNAPKRSVSGVTWSSCPSSQPSAVVASRTVHFPDRASSPRLCSQSLQGGRRRGRRSSSTAWALNCFVAILCHKGRDAGVCSEVSLP